MAEGSGAVEITTSSMLMEIKDITEVLRWFRQEQHRRVVVIVTDSMSTLQKVQKEYLYADWMEIILRGPFDHITWIFGPGHSEVVGNEQVDVLAGAAVIDNNLTGPTQCIKDHLALSTTQVSSYTLNLLKEKGVQAGKVPMIPAEKQQGAGRISNYFKQSAYLH